MKSYAKGSFQYKSNNNKRSVSKRITESYEIKENEMFQEDVVKKPVASRYLHSLKMRCLPPKCKRNTVLEPI